MSKKRSIGDLWSCICCELTLEDNIVPAVMQCKPFAHTICTVCADELLTKGNAKCPKCRTPFASVRPLAEFVDTEDGNVASALAKKSKSSADTFQEKLDQVLETIDSATMRERVKHMTKRMERSLTFLANRSVQSCMSGDVSVPDFDRDNVKIRVKGKRTRDDLQRAMERVTSGVITHVQPLFPKLVIKPYSNGHKPARYLWIHINKIN